MPLTIEGDRVPAFWAERARSWGNRDENAHEDSIRIALINNMPDPALEDTELQFFELLDSAAGDVSVRVTLYSLPGVARRERGQERLRELYCGMDDLWNSHADAVIMTGTEPHRPDLQEEPYWGMLTQVLDWAAENTGSVILSCLAAHAGVLYFDGITRHTLSDKRFGIFDSGRVCDHVLTNRVTGRIKFPHSRWNEVREEDLIPAGYVILTKSAQAGVDLFAKRKRRSLFVYVQGHPEYGAQTLLKEYRRDVRRFLDRERDTYPLMPEGYFDAAAVKLLAEFKENALTDRRKDRIDSFPQAAVGATLRRTWHSSARRVYRNWLNYVRSIKAEAPRFTAVSRSIETAGATEDGPPSRRDEVNALL